MAIDKIFEGKTRGEIVQLIYTLHFQNTNGRETHDEMFKLGIEACYDELRGHVRIVRHSCDAITEEYIYKNDFRFQRTMFHQIWFVTFQNHLITFGQYRHDLEQWIDSNYA